MGELPTCLTPQHILLLFGLLGNKNRNHLPKDVAIRWLADRFFVWCYDIHSTHYKSGIGAGIIYFEAEMRMYALVHLKNIQKRNPCHWIVKMFWNTSYLLTWQKGANCKGLWDFKINSGNNSKCLGKDFLKGILSQAVSLVIKMDGW